jgi:Flp pilus assembly protein TadD
MFRLIKLVQVTVPALILVLSASVANSQIISATDSGLRGANSVSGTVLGPDGARVTTHMSIRLVTQMRGDRYATLDDSGNFRFVGLVNGDYSILIDKQPDLESSNTPFSVNQTSGFDGQSIVLNIRLKYKKGVVPKSAAPNAALAQVPKAALDLYNQAADKAKHGDTHGSIQLLDQAVKAYPEFTDAYNDMGVEYLKLQDLDKADTAFQAALKIDKTSYSAMLNHGMTLYYLKKFADAVPVLREAQNMKSGEAGPHYFLGQSLAYLGTFAEAEAELTTAVAIAPAQTAEAYRLLAIMHSSEGKKKEAAEDLEKYLKLNPQAPDADGLKEAIKKLRAGT